VLPRLQELSRILNVYILTADTSQNLGEITRSLEKTAGIEIHALESGRGDIQKLYFLERIGREKTAAIGNGCNDVLMLKEAALGVCVIGSEGAAVEAMIASKALFLNICDALDIFIKRNRMIATLRK
jgi:soluble P-type ATPase